MKFTTFTLTALASTAVVSATQYQLRVSIDGSFDRLLKVVDGRDGYGIDWFDEEVPPEIFDYTSGYMDNTKHGSVKSGYMSSARDGFVRFLGNKDGLVVYGDARDKVKLEFEDDELMNLRPYVCVDEKAPKSHSLRLTDTMDLTPAPSGGCHLAKLTRVPHASNGRLDHY